MVHKKSALKAQTSFNDNLTPFGHVTNAEARGNSIYGTNPFQWENNIHHVHGELSIESDIIRCNNRLKANLRSSAQDNLIEDIPKLGVAAGNSRKGIKGEAFGI